MVSHYQTKTNQRAASGGRCAYCGRRASTQSHHLWLRRKGKEAEKYLQADINQVQLCPMCHHAETYMMQVTCGLAKLWDLFDRNITVDPPLFVEEWVASYPSKIPVDLPSHFWEAATMYSQGIRPGQYRQLKGR